MDKFKGIASGLFMIVLAGATAWFAGPSLLQDVTRMGQPTTLAETHKFKEGECRTRIAILAICDISIVDLANNNTNVDVHYAFLNISVDITLDVLEYQDGSATTTLGIANLWNRIGVFLLFFGIFTVTGLRALWRTIRGA